MQLRSTYCECSNPERDHDKSNDVMDTAQTLKPVHVQEPGRFSQPEAGRNRNPGLPLTRL